jgi:glycosyltransferase involved in cell wall biosynthesis
MKVLMVFHAPPYPPDIGPSRRHYHVLTETMRRHDVTVLSLGSAADRKRLLDHTGLDRSRVRFVSGDRSRARKFVRASRCLLSGTSDFGRLRLPAMQQALDAALSAERFDAVYCSTVMLGCYRLPRGIPLVGDTHNVEHDALARAAAAAPARWRQRDFGVQAALTRREEQTYLRKFDVVCATSSRDLTVFKRLAPGVRVEVVPNGIDLEKYTPPVHPRREPGLLLFTGLISYYPNQHAILRFVRRVLPLVRERTPHARLMIVGADPPARIRALESEGVHVTGWVPDVRPYYARAHVSVVPLRIGGGTRVKVLESMAMGVPVVSTSLGCEGLDVENERSVLIADSDAALARAIVRVLRAPTLARSLAAHGREIAAAYDWRDIGCTLDDVLRTAGHQPRAAREPGYSQVGDLRAS